MAFLLDTNIVSETIRPKPEPRVLDWIEAQTPAELFLAAQTIGELVRGARKVKEKVRRERFERWIEQELAQQFEGRVLPFDGPTATLWGRFMGDGEKNDGEKLVAHGTHGWKPGYHNIRDLILPRPKTHLSFPAPGRIQDALTSASIANP